MTSKFYVFDRNHEPLCYNGQALEFDTAESAEDFLETIDSWDFADLDIGNAIIIDDIFFTPIESINATNLKVEYVYNENGDWENTILTERI